MTNDEYRAALAQLGWTQGQAAEQLGISVRSSNGYANGTDIPKLVSLALSYFLVTQTKGRKR